jgi:hypothetical protein
LKAIESQLFAFRQPRGATVGTVTVYVPDMLADGSMIWVGGVGTAVVARERVVVVFAVMTAFSGPPVLPTTNFPLRPLPNAVMSIAAPAPLPAGAGSGRKMFIARYPCRGAAASR